MEYLEGTDPHYVELRLERLLFPSISIGVVAVVVLGVYVVRIKN
jgi:hypothetical protein